MFKASGPRFEVRYNQPAPTHPVPRHATIKSLHYLISFVHCMRAVFLLLIRYSRVATANMRPFMLRRLSLAHGRHGWRPRTPNLIIASQHSRLSLQRSGMLRVRLLRRQPYWSLSYPVSAECRAQPISECGSEKRCEQRGGENVYGVPAIPG